MKMRKVVLSALVMFFGADAMNAPLNERHDHENIRSVALSGWIVDYYDAEKGVVIDYNPETGEKIEYDILTGKQIEYVSETGTRKETKISVPEPVVLDRPATITYNVATVPPVVIVQSVTGVSLYNLSTQTSISSVFSGGKELSFGSNTIGNIEPITIRCETPRENVIAILQKAYNAIVTVTEGIYRFIDEYERSQEESWKKFHTTMAELTKQSVYLGK